MEERRKHERYKAKDQIYVHLKDELSDMKNYGKLINISKSGAYILGGSFPFQTAFISFKHHNGTIIQKKCRRVSPYRQGCIGMSVVFLELLDDQDLELLKTEAICLEL